METIREHLTYEKADLNELPKRFEELSKTLEFIHSKGAVVHPLNSDTTGYDSPEFSSLRRPIDFEKERRENIVSLGKLMVGCYVSNETGFKDFSDVDTNWFSEKEGDIFNCFHYEDFDREYFKPLFDNQKNMFDEPKDIAETICYYHVYLNRKRQAERLKGAAQNKGTTKSLVNPHFKGLTDSDESLNTAAQMHISLNPLLIGMSIAIFAVITIMVILLN